ncbi:MATE family efflux transporter [Lacrimispora sp. 38-1]|uniref:MATE family efflux transporter n=1 Tax=Lacrimispora sp. 38-1 TaxID=3125778 RepID=UPI003CEE1D5D
MSNKNDTRSMLLHDSPQSLVLKLSVPAIIGMVVIGLYNFMDGVYVGQMVGDNAMAAISVSYPFTLANSGISTLIGIGSASILSRAIGKKDQSTIDKIMGNLIAMNLIFSLVIMVVGMVFTKQILMLSGARGEILELALRYLRIIFAGSLFVNFAQSSNMIMRGEGLLKQAMLFSAGSAIMNIILDPIFILLLKPYNMGIDGAAYATVASQIAYAIASLWYFKKKSKNVKINAIRVEKTLFSEIIGVGFSAMLMQVMMLVQQTALYNLAAQYGGDTWQIILGATYRVVSFAFIPLWGLSQGYQPAVGTNYGAKQYDRVKHITKVFAITATLLALIFYLPIMLVPKTILSMFITTPSVVEQGVGDFRLFFLSYILLGVWIVVLTLMQSLGRATKASVLVILRQIAIYIPAAIIMPYIAGFGVHGVFAAPLITDVTVFIVAVGMMINEFRRMDALKASGR